MGWIKQRIESELRKHKDLDWALLAEKKIIAELKERGLYKSPTENICELCNGSGLYSDYDEDHFLQTVQCMRCKGTGKLPKKNLLEEKKDA